MRWLPHITLLRVLALSLVSVALLFPMLELTRVNHWIDPVTGTWKSQRSWCFGIDQRPVIQSSPFDRWLASQNTGHTPNWNFVGGSTLSGGRYCGAVPPNYSFIRSHDIQQAYLSVASVQEIDTLLDVFRTGTEDQVESATNEAFEKILDSW